MILEMYFFPFLQLYRVHQKVHDVTSSFNDTYEDLCLRYAYYLSNKYHNS